MTASQIIANSTVSFFGLTQKKTSKPRITHRFWRGGNLQRWPVDSPTRGQQWKDVLKLWCFYGIFWNNILRWLTDIIGPVMADFSLTTAKSMSVSAKNYIPGRFYEFFYPGIENRHSTSIDCVHKARAGYGDLEVRVNHHYCYHHRHLIIIVVVVIIIIMEMAVYMYIW